MPVYYSLVAADVGVGSEVVSPAATVAGNEITDASRAAALGLATTDSGTRVDQYSSDSSFGIFRAATNLFRRGQCDTNSVWNNFNSIVGRVTDATVPPPFSTQSIKYTTSGLTTQEGCSAVTNTGLAIAAGTNGVGSCWFKGVAGLTYSYKMRWANTDASTTDGSFTTFTATGSWQLLTASALAVAAGKTGDKLVFVIVTATTRAEDFWVAHCMLEVADQPTPYITTTGGSTATKAAGLVSLPSSLISSSQGWFACRIRAGFTSPDSNNTHPIFSWATAASLGLILQYRGSAGQWDVRREDSGATLQLGVSQSFALGDEITLVFAWTATQIKLSINGGAFTALGNTEVAPPGLPTTFQIGGNPSLGTARGDSDFFWAAVGSGTLTDADALTIYNFGKNDRRPAEFPGTSTAVWFADTSTYLTANDTYLHVAETQAETGTGADASSTTAVETGADTGTGAEVNSSSLQTFGRTTLGTLDDTPNSNAKAVSATAFTAIPGVVTKMTGYLSGLGPGVGNQKVRAVIYEDGVYTTGASSSARLLAVSDEVTITDGAAYSWVDFNFSKFYQLSAVAVRLGYIWDTPTDGSQIKAFTGGALRYQNTGSDTYSDGPDPTFGIVSGAAGSISDYSLYVTVDVETRLYAAEPADDAGTGADSGSVNTGTIPISGSDTGSGADASALAVAETQADTGSSTDASSLVSRISGTGETSTGADASAETARYTQADTGSGADASTEHSAYTGADTGSGADASTAHAAETSSDTGTSTDASALVSRISPAETGTGVEGTTEIALSSADENGTSSEVAGLGFTDGDTGSGDDTGDVEIPIYGDDTGSGVEDTDLTASIVAAENNTPVENTFVAALLGGSDSAVGLDNSSFLAFLSVNEHSVLSDTISQLSAHFNLLESAVGIDEVIQVVLQGVADTGVGVTNGTLHAAVITNDGAAGVDSIFSLRARLQANDNGTLDQEYAEILAAMDVADFLNGIDVGTLYTRLFADDTGVGASVEGLNTFITADEIAHVVENLQLVLDGVPEGDVIIIGATTGDTAIVATRNEGEITGGAMQRPVLLSAETGKPRLISTKVEDHNG